jgi:hypothetical protein
MGSRIDYSSTRIVKDRNSKLYTRALKRVGKIQKNTYLVVSHRGLDELRAMQSEQVTPQVGGAACRQFRVAVVTR